MILRFIQDTQEKRLWTCTLWLVASTFVFGFSSKAKGQVVKQGGLDEFACGPCSIVNAMRHSVDLRTVLANVPGKDDETKAAHIFSVYGGRTSISYKGEKRFSKKREGMSCVDLARTFQDVLSDTDSSLSLQGQFLNRLADEKLTSHLRRIHGLFKGSLDSGIPVVLSVRSFAAQLNEPKSKWLWEGISAHYVAVVKVQPTIELNEKGFTFQYLDSHTGNREYGYISIDEARNFSAAKGDSEKWEWLNDRPFLVITAPSLRLKTQKQGFHQRTVITVNYAILPDREGKAPHRNPKQ